MNDCIINNQTKSATHRLDMPNTSAKLYGNPFMQYKVMARTQKNSDAQTDGRCAFNMPPKDKKKNKIYTRGLKWA